MATYKTSWNSMNDLPDSMRLQELDIYGSSRIGILGEDTLVGCQSCSTAVSSGAASLWTGKKMYELTNHLGNVLSTITDKKIFYDANLDSIADYSIPEIASQQDYYPFGMPMPGRSLSLSNYRFGFNTQEKIDEVSGQGNHNTALFWEYDTRLGTRWNVDPKPYPSISYYNCFRGNPIWYNDMLGDSADFYNEKGKLIGSDGKVDGKVFVVPNKNEVKNIQKNEKNNKNTPIEDVKSAIELPGLVTRKEMGSVTDMDAKDNSREYGGFYGTDENGNAKVVFAKPGPHYKSEEDAEINPMIASDPEQIDDIKYVQGTFHSHPSAVSSTDQKSEKDHFSSGSVFGGSTRETKSIIQTPSSDDIKNAAIRQANGLTSGNSFVIGAGNKQVYIYNGSGVQATFPLDKFISVGK